MNKIASSSLNAMTPTSKRHYDPGHPGEASHTGRVIYSLWLRYIKQNYVKGKFSWQEGYGAFSYSHSQISRVYNYILNQEKHHSKRSFREEYVDLLEKYDVEFEESYLFELLKD